MKKLVLFRLAHVLGFTPNQKIEEKNKALKKKFRIILRQTLDYYPGGVKKIVYLKSHKNDSKLFFTPVK